MSDTKHMPLAIAQACENSWNWLMHRTKTGPLVSPPQLQEAARLLRQAYPERKHCDTDCLTHCAEPCQFLKRVNAGEAPEAVRAALATGAKNE